MNRAPLPELQPRIESLVRGLSEAHGLAVCTGQAEDMTRDTGIDFEALRNTWDLQLARWESARDYPAERLEAWLCTREAWGAYVETIEQLRLAEQLVEIVRQNASKLLALAPTRSLN